MGFYIYCLLILLNGNICLYLFRKIKIFNLKKIDVKKNYMIMSIVKNNLKLKKFINTFGHETETNEA